MAKSTKKALCLEVYSEGPPSDEDSDLEIDGFQDMRPQDCKLSEKKKQVRAGT